MRHVAGGIVLPEHTVDPQPNVEVLRVLDLVRRDNRGSHRCEGMPGLTGEEVVQSRSTEATRRTIDEVDVAENVVECVFGTHVPGPLADDERQFCLMFEDIGRLAR